MINKSRIHELLEIPMTSNYEIFYGVNLKRDIHKIEDNDEIISIKQIKGSRVPLGSVNGEEEPYSYWVVLVKRWRNETSDEYYQRMKKEVYFKIQKIEKEKQEEEMEKLEYLRLKAKYEKD